MKRYMVLYLQRSRYEFEDANCTQALFSSLGNQSYYFLNLALGG